MTEGKIQRNLSFYAKFYASRCKEHFSLYCPLNNTLLYSLTSIIRVSKQKSVENKDDKSNFSTFKVNSYTKNFINPGVLYMLYTVILVVYDCCK